MGKIYGEAGLWYGSAEKNAKRPAAGLENGYKFCILPMHENGLQVQ